MENLAELLKGQSPVVPTRKALLVIDLQNDLVHPNGKCPLELPDDFKEEIVEVAQALISSGISVIWIKSIFETDRIWRMGGGMEQAGGDAVLVDKRPAPPPPLTFGSGPGPIIADDDDDDDDDDDEDEEDEDDLAAMRAKLEASRAARQQQPSAVRPPPLQVPTSNQKYFDLRKEGKLPRELFLSARAAADNCCMKGTAGSEIISDAKKLFQHQPHRLELSKTKYSSFESDLLIHLRTSLITELYLCGPSINTSIFATAAVAAQHGFEVSLVDNCIGRNNYDAVVTSLDNIYGVGIVSSKELLDSYGKKQLRRSVVPSTSEPSLGVRRRDSQQISRLPIRSGRNASINALPRSPLSTSHSPTSSPPPQLPQTPSGGNGELRPSRYDESRSPSRPTLKASGDSRQSIKTPPPSEPSATLDASALASHLGSLSIDKSTFIQRPQEKTSVHNEPRDRRSGKSPEAAKYTARKSRRPQQHPVLGPDDDIGEGGSYVVYDAFARFQQDSNVFEKLKNEVLWQKMYHVTGEVPRLVCAQGIIEDDGSTPVYRHPSDQSLPLLHYSPIINAIRRKTQQIVGHPLNHCLVQLYRSGQDFISEHSDKTLDIMRGSSIVNVSFGAQRTMRLRTKKSGTDPSSEGGRLTQLVPLPHCSIFVLDQESNMKWLHGINADKRPATERSPAELTYNGERISLTFRYIGTFLDKHNKSIWGQGASSKDPGNPSPVINGNEQATQAMVNAFGAENQSSNFDWDAVYGNGFDVLHFRSGFDDASEPLIFLSGNSLTDTRVRIALEELQVKYKVAGVAGDEAGRGYEHEICLRDTDSRRTQVYGDVAILLYAAERYRRLLPPSYSPAVMAEGLRLLTDRKYLPLDAPAETLPRLEALLSDKEYVAGDVCVSADVYVWPVVDDWMEQRDIDPDVFPRVVAWHEAVSLRESVRRVVWSDARE